MQYLIQFHGCKIREPPWDAQGAGSCTEAKALHPPLLPEPFGSRPSGASWDAMDAMDAMPMDDSLPGLYDYKGILDCFLGFFWR